VDNNDVHGAVFPASADAKDVLKVIIDEVDKLTNSTHGIAELLILQYPELSLEAQQYLKRIGNMSLTTQEILKAGRIYLGEEV
jgi:hypothetical protein